MPTVNEFININPETYGEGNVNLLISCSAVNPPFDNTPVPPFFIQGLTLPLTTKNSINVRNALSQVTTIKFSFENQIETTIIQDRQDLGTHYYLKIDPIQSTTLPSTVASGDVEVDSEFVFIPFFTKRFFFDDDNVLQNNYEATRQSTIKYRVDRNASQFQPTNLDRIISQSATLAEVQDSNYSNKSVIIARYEGAKETNNGVAGREPALALTQFKGSIHPLTSDVTNLKSLDAADREVIDIFFDSHTTGSGPSKAFATFPSGSHFLFKGVENSNRFEKLTSIFALSLEDNKVFTTNEQGRITLVQ